MKYHDLEPGDVVLVQCSDANWREAMFVDTGSTASFRFADGLMRPVEQSKYRRLVVIDPENHKQVANFCQAMASHKLAHAPWESYSEADRERVINNAADSLRSLLEDPKPAEPLGLGAVVIDAAGFRWTRAANHQQPFVGGNGNWRAYADIAVVEVISAGVGGAA